MRAYKLPLAFVALVATVFSLWPSDKPPADDARYLVGRLWIEREPRHERDQVHFLALVEDPQKVGSLVYASAWRIQAENFRFGLDGNRLRLRFPQDNKRLNATVKTTKCKAPEPFTLCLDLVTRNKRDEAAKTFRMYSREDWVFDDDGQLSDGVATPSVRGAMGAAMASASASADDDDDERSEETITQLGRMLPAAPID